MKKLITLWCVLAALLPAMVMAQTAKAAPKAQAILEWVDDETQILLTDAKGNPLTPNVGMALPAGTIVKTLKSGAEIQLKPNGTIIKLSTSTTFQIEALKEGDTAGSNDFFLKAGKLRTVAAKLTNSGAPGYNVRTATANCGVRGTDFAMMYDAVAKKDWVCVQEGLVDFTNVVTGATVPVAVGQFANTFDDTFAAAAVGADQLAQLFGGLDFVKLDPKAVPGKTAGEAQAVTDPAADGAASDSTPAPAAPAAKDPMTELLTKLFGMEVGSVTINGVLYSKAVLAPQIDLNNFRLGLYLPIVYQDDMFRPSTWYRPAGNDEWSFGSDQHSLTSKVSDFATDLALKIKFLEWGRQDFDPWYLKLGNLNTMTLGHGTIVRNFANDQDFPAIRKIGLNAGAKFGPVAIEGLADDLTAPSVVGGRFGVDLIGDQVAVGFQAAADLNWAATNDLAGATLNTSGLTSAEAAGQPILVVGGIDTQLFQVNAGPLFRTKAFADANALVPYFRQDSAALGATQGFAWKTIWNDGPGSLGAEAGFYGNILMVNYRLSYQYQNGLYRNALFRGDYYRTKVELLDQMKGYLADPSDLNSTTLQGIAGTADFDLFGLLTMGATYQWPLEFKADGTIGPAADDFFAIHFDIPKDKIPFVNLSGGLAYERSKFVYSLIHGEDLLDARSVLKGTVIYGLTPGMDLVVGVLTSTLRDSSGQVIFENGLPKVAPTITLDTKLSL